MRNFKNILLDLNNDKQYAGKKSQNYINELLNIETLNNLSKYDELSRSLGNIYDSKTIKSTFLDEDILSKGLSSYDELSRGLGSIIDDK